MRSVYTSEDESTCKARVGGVLVETLLDTGAAASLIDESTYRRTKHRGELMRSDMNMSQVNGGKIKITGMVDLKVKVGGIDRPHRFYITPGLCNELILGEDWMRQNKVQLDYETNSITVGGMEVQLGKSRERELPVSLGEDVQIPPRTAVSCEGISVGIEVGQL